MYADSRRGRGHRLPRARRLSGSTEIRTLFRRGKRSRTSHLDVLDSASPVDFSRVGWVVPKHRQDAVRRNRLKRRIREIVRQEVLPRLDERGRAVDVIVRARAEAYDASYGELRSELVEWLENRWRLEPRSG